MRNDLIANKANELFRVFLRQRIHVSMHENVLLVKDSAGKSALRVGCYCDRARLHHIVVEAHSLPDPREKTGIGGHSWGGTVKPMTVVRWVLGYLEKL